MEKQCGECVHAYSVSSDSLAACNVCGEDGIEYFEEIKSEERN